ncbi:MAG: AAA family ATPase [Acidimicrobiales bacterium]
MAELASPRSSVLQARLLGPFSLSRGELTAGPWERPSARRLVQLLLVSPGRRMTRDAAREALFPHMGPEASRRALNKAISMARAALAYLGEDGRCLLVAEAGLVRADGTVLEVDCESQVQALENGLAMAPGTARDEQLSAALANEGVLLEDEPYSDWALRPRGALDKLRQEARLALARDRTKGYGRPAPTEVVRAWEACFALDPSCEEAAVALMRSYGAQNRHTLAETTYKTCQAALGELGLRPSRQVEEARWADDHEREHGGPPSSYQGQERRLVSVLSAEVSGPVGAAPAASHEERAELVGDLLAEVVAQIEAMGGTVSSVSGQGLVALFGAPEGHEDDPERALRAALRSMRASGGQRGDLCLRFGVETGPALVGRVGGGASGYYGAVGDVVSVAGAVSSAARPGGVLVGPATRAATERIFDWGAPQPLVISPEAGPLSVSYVERPKARPAGEAGRRRLAGRASLVGREPELAVLRDALRDTTAGRGREDVLAGEPGRGQTRLVDECRKLFMAWVGAATGRLPLWVEGRAASYSSGTPYGLFQRLLTAWAGAVPEEGEEVARAALERAVRAAFGGKVNAEQVSLLGVLLGLPPGKAALDLSRLGPEALQEATFAAVTALVSKLASHGPTVLVLEDLHWSDATSLRLAERVAALTTTVPLLMVITRRPEPDPGVSALESALASKPGLVVRTVELGPLSRVHERELARSLLGSAAKGPLVDAVRQGAEGNPFFLEERLASLLETRSLVRDDQGGWTLDPSAPAELPGAIERLVRSRVDRLGSGAHEAIVAASVLGPELNLNALAAMTQLDGALGEAISQLCSSGLLVDLGSHPEQAYRFRHALIQEATYKGLLRRERRRLHSRAASALAEMAAGRQPELMGVLGHHFAMAGEVEKAAHYLEMAADEAAKVFANDEALAFYRRALEVLKAGGDEPARRLAGISAKFAELCWLIGRYAEGQAVLEEATELGEAAGTVPLAQCFRWLGAIANEEHRHGEALAACARGEAALESRPAPEDDDWVAAWLEIQITRCWVHDERSEVEAFGQVLTRAQPLAETRAGPEQKSKFLQLVNMHDLLAHPRLPDETILGRSRAAWSIALEAGLGHKMKRPSFLGVDLAQSPHLAEAREELEASIAMSEKAGDRSTVLRGWSHLAWCALRQHDVALAAEMARRAGDLARDLPHVACAELVPTVLVWVAWKEGRFDDAERQAELARCQPLVDRFHSTGQILAGRVFPVVAIRLVASRVEEAVDAAGELLFAVPPPPDEVVGAISAAVEAWDAGDQAGAAEKLAAAFRLAEDLQLV